MNLTREALKNSLAVQGIGTEIQNICVDAERQRKRTDNLVSKNSKSFLEGQQMNEDNLKVLDNEITKFEQEIPTLNQEVYLTLLYHPINILIWKLTILE